MPLGCKCVGLQPSWRPVRPALAAEPHYTHQPASSSPLTASAKSTPTCRSGTRTGHDRPPPRFIDKSIAVRGGLFCQLWLSRNGSPSANGKWVINDRRIRSTNPLGITNSLWDNRPFKQKPPCPAKHDTKHHCQPTTTDDHKPKRHEYLQRSATRSWTTPHTDPLSCSLPRT